MVTTEGISEPLPTDTSIAEEDSFSVVGDDGRPKERWAPLGANSSPEPSYPCQLDYWDDVDSSAANYDEFSKLTCENERMNQALMALTSHFAQVQFRIGQVLNADASNREEMLRSLEEFASRGIPELPLFLNSSKEHSTALSDYLYNLQPKPQQIIEELRKQLDELERFAYEIGEQQEPPTQATLEKQRVMLEELGSKLNLDVSKLYKLSQEESKSLINSVVHQFLNPLKLNEQLVEQLKTQVIDLERFIDFLHDSGACSTALSQAFAEFKRSPQRAAQLISHEYNSLTGCLPDTETSATGFQFGRSRHLYPMDADNSCHSAQGSGRPAWNRRTKPFRSKDSQERTLSVLQRAMAILHIFTSAHLASVTDPWLLSTSGSSKNGFYVSDTPRNSATVERAKSQHWGGVRARLEIAIAMVLDKTDLLRSFQLATNNRLATQETTSTMQPINSQSNLHSPEHSIPRSSSTNPYRHSSASGSFVYACDQVLGTRISLPVQCLHRTIPRTASSSRKSTDFSSNQSRNPRTHDFLSGQHTRITSVQNSLDTQEFLRSEANRMVGYAVRRYLCPALIELIEHGLLKRPLSTVVEESSGKFLRASLLFRPIWSCLSARHQTALDDYIDSTDPVNDSIDVYNRASLSGRSSVNRSGTHAWHVLLRYYYMKNGQLYNQSPARRLSKSFDLDSYGGKAVTVRQRFFNAIGVVLECHSKFKRSDDAQFKSFVSIALNEGKLVSWLRLVFKYQPLVTAIYQPWSYTLSTGFDDALQSLNRLTDVEFNLPYDYSVRHLREIQDAF